MNEKDYFKHFNDANFQTKYTEKGYWWSTNGIDWYPVPKQKYHDTANKMSKTMPKDQPVDELAEKLLALPTHNKPLLFDVDELVKLIQAECNRASQEAYKKGYIDGGLEATLKENK